MAAAPQDHNERAFIFCEALVDAPDGVDDEVPRRHGARLPLHPTAQVGALAAAGERRRVAAEPHLVPASRRVDGVKTVRVDGVEGIRRCSHRAPTSVCSNSRFGWAWTLNQACA